MSDSSFNDEDDAVLYDLVMPFVVVTSVGGPYDDEAFSAGWNMGRIDAQLTLCQSMALPFPLLVVRTPSRPQVDLIAMKHGLHIASSADTEDGWTTVELKRNEPA